MALNIKNAEVERLAAEVARLTGESKTEAIRRALQERSRTLRGAGVSERRARALRYLRKSVWARLPAHALGRSLTQAEEDRLLGFGSDGV